MGRNFRLFGVTIDLQVVKEFDAVIEARFARMNTGALVFLSAVRNYIFERRKGWMIPQGGPGYSLEATEVILRIDFSSVKDFRSQQGLREYVFWESLGSAP